MASGAIALMPVAIGQSRTYSPGLQLYTVRGAMKEDPKGTLKKVADIGYKVLETAAYGKGKFYGYEASEFSQIVGDLGMETVSSHVGVGEILKNTQQILDAMGASGQKYLVVPWIGDQYRSSDGYKELADALNEKGELCNKSGIKLLYHNHAFEFEKYGKTTGMDILLDRTDKEVANFEADLYWVVKAGLDPLEFIKKNPGRFLLWHVKDMDDTPKQDFAEVGTGVIDYARLFKHSDVSGLEYFFVEQDRSDNPMQSIQISFNGVEKIL